MAGLNYSGLASRSLATAVTDYQQQLNAGRAINNDLHTADRRTREAGLMPKTPSFGLPLATDMPPVGGDRTAFHVGSTYQPSVGVQARTPMPAPVAPVSPAAREPVPYTSPTTTTPAVPQTASAGRPNAVETGPDGVPRPTLAQWKAMNPETRQTILDATNKQRYDVTGTSVGRAMAIKRVPKKPLTMQEYEATLAPGMDPNIAAGYMARGNTAAPTAGVQTPGVANQYQPIFEAASRAYGVDVSLLTRMGAQESSFNPNATSPKGAGGVMQLMPGTASDLQVSNVYDPQQNIMGGAQYISQMLNKYNGDQTLALMAYNWGPGNVDKWIAEGRDPARVPKETTDYVKKITGAAPTGAAPTGAAPTGGSAPQPSTVSNDKRVRFAVSKQPEQYAYDSQVMMRNRDQYIASVQQQQQLLLFQQQQADTRFMAAKQAGDYDGMLAANKAIEDANLLMMNFVPTAQASIDKFNQELITLESDRAVRELAGGDPSRAAMLYSNLSGEQRRYEPSADGTFVAINGAGTYVIDATTGRAKKYTVEDIAYEIFSLADKERAAAMDTGRAAQQGKVNEHSLELDTEAFKHALEMEKNAAQHTYDMDKKVADLRIALATAAVNGEYDLKQKLMEMDRDISTVKESADGSIYIIYKGQSGKVVKLTPNAVQTIGDGTEIPANEISVMYTNNAGINTAGAPVN